MDIFQTSRHPSLDKLGVGDRWQVPVPGFHPGSMCVKPFGQLRVIENPDEWRG